MEAIKSQLDSVLAKLESNEALISDVKAMKESGEEFRKSLSAETANLNAKADALQAQLDGVDARTQAGFAGAKKGANFSSELEKALSGESFANYKSGNANKVKLDLELKGSDMTVGNAYSGEVIPADRVPDLKFTPNRKVNVRQLLPVGQTSSNLIRFVRESAYDNAAEPTAQGSPKPQSDFDLTAVDRSIRTIPTFMRLTKEMLDDTPGLIAYLSSRAPSKLLNVEDTQLLYGSGSGQNLHGFATDGSAWTTVKFGTLINRFDVLAAAVVQTTKNEYSPNAIMINPSDYLQLVSVKESTGGYIIPSYVTMSAGQMFIMGVPVYAINGVVAGDFFVGDFALGSQLFVRQGITLEFFEQDADNVTKNFVTVRVEERIALAVYTTQSIVYGTFAAALANGSAV
jgi:HK97 family phage major capsid protein